LSPERRAASPLRGCQLSADHPSPLLTTADLPSTVDPAALTGETHGFLDVVNELATEPAGAIKAANGEAEALGEKGAATLAKVVAAAQVVCVSNVPGQNG